MRNVSIIGEMVIHAKIVSAELKRGYNIASKAVTKQL